MEEDKELYQNFINGDTTAYERLILKHKDNLIYFIQRYVKDLYIAEDISQDVFAIILMNRDKYDFKYSFKTYLYTIAKNRALDIIKKDKKIIKIDNLYSYINDNNIEDLVLKNEYNKNIAKAISNLKTDYQTVIYLVDFEKFTYNEVCKIMNKSLPQIKILIYRARKMLKDIIEKEDFLYEK